MSFFNLLIFSNPVYSTSTFDSSEINFLLFCWILADSETYSESLGLLVDPDLDFSSLYVKTLISFFAATLLFSNSMINDSYSDTLTYSSDAVILSFL
jgi:hypothetical protein